MNAPAKPNNHLIGASVKRKEDFRFLASAGQYTDDVVQAHQFYVVFLRSPYAHARIKHINTDAAYNHPGVLAVLTGDDLAADKVNGPPCSWLIRSIDGTPMKEPSHPVLAQGKMRHMGDQVVLAVAESVKIAKDAIEMIDIEYDELPVVVDAATADTVGTAVHDDTPNNTCCTRGHGDKAVTGTVFARATYVVRLDIINNRLIPNAIGPRAVNASYSRQDDSCTLYVANQNPHVERLLISAFVLDLAEAKVHVTAPDVGGELDSKIFLYPEDMTLTWVPKKVGRPIRWIIERSESFLIDTHGRDHVTHAKLTLDAQDNFLAMRVHTTTNMGAYLSAFASSMPTILYATPLAGQYKTPAIYAEVKAVLTNTAPVDTYRGAGRPEATYVVGRLVETAAHELQIDPAELRHRNSIRTFPYAAPVGLMYDAGDYEPCLDHAIELADVKGFAVQRDASRAKGRLRDMSYSCYIEACGLAPSSIAGTLGARAGLFEASEIRVHPTGSITVFTGSHSHGQGHETTSAQMVADRLGVPIDNIEIMHGGTGRIPFGTGTYGLRSITVGSSAVMRALGKIEARAKKIAAHLLEVSTEDIEFKDGVFRMAGTDRTKTLGEVALTAYVPYNYPPDKLEPGLDENAFYDPTNFTYPAGAYICEVEADPDTGEVHIGRLVAVDDSGNIINPMIVEGQVHGGFGQGIGQTLLEACVYDESGQLLTGSYMDYATPRANDLLSFTVEIAKGTPCMHNPLGVKGCDEAGAIGSPPALINAIVDALAPLGVKDIQMPVTPHRVWQTIQAAKAQAEERIMHDLEYQKATDAQTVVAAPETHADARYLGGGQSLLAAMKLRLAQPLTLVDVTRVLGMSDIRTQPGVIMVGTATRHAGMADSVGIARMLPALGELAGGIGGCQVCAMGTLGGSLANNDPATCYPAAVFGLNVIVVIERRNIAADGFFLGMYETALTADELITEVQFPAPDQAVYVKFRNPMSRSALVGMFINRKGNNVRVAVTGAAPSVFHCMPLEQALAASFTSEAARKVVVPADDLVGDLHAPLEYRAHLIPILAARTVEQALAHHH